MTVVCRPEDFAKLFSELEAKRVEALKAATVEAATIGVRVVRSHVPVDRGELRKTTHLEVHEAASTPGASGPIASIVEDQPYAAAMEVGTRPFTPPFAPILAWAKRQAPNVGIDPSDADAIERFARAVWMTIRKFGIKAKFGTRAALPKLGSILLAKLRAAQRDWNKSIAA